MSNVERKPETAVRSNLLRGWSLTAVVILAALTTLFLTAGPETAQSQSPDTTPPFVKSVSAIRDGARPHTQTTLKLTFSEDLDVTSKPAGSAFRVVSRLAHIERIHVGTGVAIIEEGSGANSLTQRIVKVRLVGEGNPDWIFGAASLTVTYTKPTINPLQDEASNDVATFTSTPRNRSGRSVECHWETGTWYVTNTYSSTRRDGHISDIPCDMAKPALYYRNPVVWFYNRVNVAPPVDQPVASVIYTAPRKPNHRAVLGTDDNCYREERVNGQWQRSISYGSSVTEDCRKASWNAYKRAYRPAVPFPVMINPNGGTFPSGPPPAVAMFDSATVDGKTLALTFDRNLDTASEPARSAFTVTVNNARRSVASDGVAISGSTVTLTLASAVAYGDTVTVRYTKPTNNPLQETHGFTVDTFTDQAVTNNTAFWTATLTAGPSGQNGNGCRTGSSTSCSTALSEDEFTVGGTDYQVEILAAGVGSDSLGIVDLQLDREIPTTWTLYVGSNDGLAVSTATRSNSNKNARWHPVNWGIGNGDVITVSLKAPPPATTTVTSTTSDSSLATQNEVTVVSVQPTPEPDSDPPSDFSLATKSDVPVVSAEPTPTPTAEPTAEPTQQAAPSVTGVNISSSPASGDTYKLGEVISVALTFSSKVDVDTSGGTPSLNIDMSPLAWGTKAASYASGSGTTSLTFTHTVVEPNYSTQGIAVLGDSLALNGGTIKSSASQEDAELSHTNRDHDPKHKVDWQQSPPGPSITDVQVSSSPASGDTYKLGETISVTLTFSEKVDVTGTPRLSIDMDPAHWGTKHASYASGTGTASITFNHTVVEPNYSTQGIAVLANSLALNGGTIRSSASNANADLSHTNRNHDANHKVNWQLSD